MDARSVTTWSAAVSFLAAGLGLAAPNTPARKPELSAVRSHPAGSAPTFRGKNVKDVVKVAFDSDGQNLLVTTTVTTPFVTAQDGGTFLELYVDADNNHATGRSDEADRTGYEFRVWFMVCMNYANGDMGCSETDRKDASRFFADFRVDQSTQKWWQPGLSEDQHFPIAGTVVGASVPYSKLGLRPGQTVRLSARESDGKVDATSFLPDATVQLR